MYRTLLLLGVAILRPQGHATFDWLSGKFSEYEWSLLLPLVVSANVAHDLLCSKVIKVGGRTMSEHTTKMVTSAHLVLTETPARLQKMSKETNHVTTNYNTND